MSSIASSLAAHPILSATFHGALTGWASAAVVDYHAFTTWKSFGEAKSYAWGIAAWRWVQGAVMGAVTGAGLGVFV